MVKTYAPGFGLDVVEVPARRGATDPDELGAAAKDAAAVIFQQPNFLGCLEPAPELAEAASEAGALAIAHVDLMSLGVLEAPGAYGCGLAIGEGQSAGNWPSYGGPHYGFLAARGDFVRRMPGRIVGETVDADGRRAYVLTLQTREQHIRREKATSNITTNQTLLALAGLATLSWLGPEGLREVGETCMALASYARERIPLEPAFEAGLVQGGRVPHARPCPRGRPARSRARHPPRVRARPGLRGDGRRAARRADGEADDRGRRPSRGRARRGVPVNPEPGRAWPDAPLLFERSRAGRRAGRPPVPDLPVPELPASLRRARAPRLPEVSEPELVRHFTALADRTFGVDTGFYPLGSCTMKHNPRVHERLAVLPGFSDLHPYQEDEAAQGALELMWRLQEILAEIAGLPAVTLQPAAGSQGELTGLMLMRAYFADRGEERDTIITADTAHGTNPASVTMAGLQAREGRDGRARQPRPRRPAREGERADRRSHAHEPVDARALRRGHRRGRDGSSTTRARSSTTTART